MTCSYCGGAGDCSYCGQSSPEPQSAVRLTALEQQAKIEAAIPKASERARNPVDDGRLMYECDVQRTPNYHDGKPRPSWPQLGTVERSSWIRAAARLNDE